MENLFHPEFKFKGSRTYIHGTDIYTQVMSILHILKIDFEKFKMSITKLSVNQLDICITDDYRNLKQNANIFFETKQNSGNIFYGYLIENEKQVKGRYEYAENLIIKSSIVDTISKTVSFNEDNQFTTIEKIVALNKTLVENLFLDIKGKWYFTKLDVNNLIDIKPLLIEIKFIKHLNFRLTQSAIYFDNEFIGYIYFSLV